MRLSYIKLIIKCCWGKKINLAINLKHHVMKQSQELNDARLQQYIRLARKPLRMVHKCRHKHFLNYLRHPRRSCSFCDMNERTKKNKQMTFFLTCICMIRIFASRERFFFSSFFGLRNKSSLLTSAQAECRISGFKTVFLSFFYF
jgi:hypothetical protein